MDIIFFIFLIIFGIYNIYRIFKNDRREKELTTENDTLKQQLREQKEGKC